MNESMFWVPPTGAAGGVIVLSSFSLREIAHELWVRTVKGKRGEWDFSTAELKAEVRRRGYDV